jgi:hypothetical protein
MLGWLVGRSVGRLVGEQCRRMVTYFLRYYSCIFLEVLWADKTSTKMFFLQTETKAGTSRMRSTNFNQYTVKLGLIFL